MPPDSHKIECRVSVALDAECLVGVLLRLEQCARGHRVAERLHELAHDDGQLPGDFIFQLRVTLFRGNLFREVHYHPATGHPAAAVGEAHRVIVHGQYHRRNMGGVCIAVFRVDGDRIAAGDGLESCPVTAPFLLVRQTYQREANQRRALAGIPASRWWPTWRYLPRRAWSLFRPEYFSRCRPDRSLRGRAASRSGSPAP